MQNRKRDTDVQNSLLDSVGEGEGGMFQENSMETCILSRVKQITSPGGMHETSARAWCRQILYQRSHRGTDATCGTQGDASPGSSGLYCRSPTSRDSSQTQARREDGEMQNFQSLHPLVTRLAEPIMQLKSEAKHSVITLSHHEESRNDTLSLYQLMIKCISALILPIFRR